MKKKWSLRKYRAMIRWWEDNGPPVYMSVASYLGLIKKKKTTKKTTKTSPDNELDELVSMFAQTGGII